MYPHSLFHFQCLVTINHNSQLSIILRAESVFSANIHNYTYKKKIIFVGGQQQTVDETIIAIHNVQRTKKIYGGGILILS